MGIKGFYNRNKPIFIIGTIIGVVFIGFIAFYNLNPRTPTELQEINNEMDREFYKVAYENLSNPQNSYYEGESDEYSDHTRISDEEAIRLSIQNIDETYGTLEIKYTTDGFRPRATRAILNQMAKWTNETDKTIYLHQRKNTYSELEKLVEIKSGESFEFRLTELGIWTYEENGSRNFGEIDVKSTKIIPAPEETVN